MKITKQETAMNQIASSITSGEKKSGDYLLSKDYDLVPKAMGTIFKTLMDNGIIQKTPTNSYCLTENCKSNMQDLYFEKIIEEFRHIKLLISSANISSDVVLEMLKSELENNNV